ncbi:MAG: YdcF family protein [Lachnospiraceae bacterium]
MEIAENGVCGGRWLSVASSSRFRRDRRTDHDRNVCKRRVRTDYLVVLGAQVRGTVPSRALKKRLDTAAEYLGKNLETKVVVSGGKGAGEEITEAEAMENYLLELGIEKDRIIMEDRSTTTSENLRYTGELIDREKDRSGDE